MRSTGAVLLTGLLLVAGCGGGAAETPKAKAFTVAGGVVVPGSSFGASGAMCSGITAGAPQVSGGANVTVLDAAGHKVGLGELSDGKSDGAVGCRFTFKVSNVPDGDAVYTVKIGDEVSYDFKRANARKVSIVVGLD